MADRRVMAVLMMTESHPPSSSQTAAAQLIRKGRSERERRREWESVNDRVDEEVSVRAQQRHWFTLKLAGDAVSDGISTGWEAGGRKWESTMRSSPPRPLRNHGRTSRRELTISRGLCLHVWERLKLEFPPCHTEQTQQHECSQLQKPCFSSSFELLFFFFFFT